MINQESATGAGDKSRGRLSVSVISTTAVPQNTAAANTALRQSIFFSRKIRKSSRKAAAGRNNNILETPQIIRGCKLSAEAFTDTSIPRRDFVRLRRWPYRWTFSARRPNVCQKVRLTCRRERRGG